MISSKPELFSLVANSFLFISSRIWSRFPPPKILFSTKYFMDKKQTKSTLPWLRVQTGGNFHTAQTWGLERLWLLGKACSVKQFRVPTFVQGTSPTSLALGRCDRCTRRPLRQEANPVQMISNIDLLRFSFVVNNYFLLATATKRHTFRVGSFPLSQLLEDQVMILCASCFFPHLTLTSPEDHCDLFQQQGRTRCLFTQPDCCKTEELGYAPPCS